MATSTVLTRQRHATSSVGIGPFLFQNVVESHAGGGIECLAEDDGEIGCANMAGEHLARLHKKQIPTINSNTTTATGTTILTICSEDISLFPLDVAEVVGGRTSPSGAVPG